MYIVTKEGVYRHEIKGVFEARHTAELHAAMVAEQDKDSYHKYLVSEIEVNIGKEDVKPLIEFRKGEKPRKVQESNYEGKWV